TNANHRIGRARTQSERADRALSRPLPRESRIAQQTEHLEHRARQAHRKERARKEQSRIDDQPAEVPRTGLMETDACRDRPRPSACGFSKRNIRSIVPKTKSTS